VKQAATRVMCAPPPVQALQHRSESGRHSPMKTNRLLAVAVLTVAIGAPIAAYVQGLNAPESATSPGVPFIHGFPNAQVSSQSELASLDRADEWLNSPPLTAPALRGKVVVVDFWTYTCINWRRTLPYVRAWDEQFEIEFLDPGLEAFSFTFG
jgi:hypothetical protein